MRHTLALISCLALGLGAVGSTAEGQAAVLPENLALDLVEAGFERPVFVIGDPADPTRLFVVEQPGRIQLIENGRRATRAFLDIVNRVDSSGERGLLSMAFDPRWPRRRFVYVNYTDSSGDTVIERYTVNRKLTRARKTTRLPLLQIDQPFANHNGGQLQIGADGHLYIGMGDGGGGGDPLGAGQNLSTPLGKLLRYEIRQRRLRVPADNPTLPGVGRSAIWALGLRNPWRFSFDRETGDLYIADVGQGAREEINFEAGGSPGGANYGWNAREGSLPFDDDTVPAVTPLIDPIHEYSRSEGRSITGGYVYRGTDIAELVGYYVFADFGSSRIWVLRVVDGEARNVTEISTQLLTPAGSTPTVSSFGEDAAGELYLCDYFAGAVYRLSRQGNGRATASR